MRDAGEPDDAVCEIPRRVLGNESVEPTNEVRNGEFFGKNNPSVGELKEVFMVEGEDRSALTCGNGQLCFIGIAQVPSVAGGYTGRFQVPSATGE